MSSPFMPPKSIPKPCGQPLSQLYQPPPEEAKHPVVKWLYDIQQNTPPPNNTLKRNHQELGDTGNSTAKKAKRCRYNLRERAVLGEASGNRQAMPSKEDPTKQSRLTTRPKFPDEPPERSADEALDPSTPRASRAVDPQTAIKQSPVKRPTRGRPPKLRYHVDTVESSSHDQPNLLENRPILLPTKSKASFSTKQSDKSDSISQKTTSSGQSGNSTSPSRTTSPSRYIVDKLATATPPVTYSNWLKLLEEKKPEKVKGLKQLLTAGIGAGIIPACLKDHLEKLDPERAVEIPANAYDESWNPGEGRAEVLLETMDTISIFAMNCSDRGKDENAWCQKVVLPLMEAALSPARSAFFDIISIQTQSIDTFFAPILPNGLVVNKRADYAWAFSDNHPEIAQYYETLQEKGIDLSQMADGGTRQLALSCAVEVKKDGNEQTAKAQLALWLSAGLRQRNQLLEIATETLKVANQKQKNKNKEKAKKAEADGDEPLIGWTVNGHYWSFYLAWLVDKAKESTKIAGPIITLNTQSHYGVFQLRAMLKRIEKYGRERYWVWLENEILKPLKENEVVWPVVEDG